MKTARNQIIFDKRNPNCNIITPIADIAKLIDQIPVINYSNSNIIGFVKEVTSMDEDSIYGDIVVWNDYFVLDKMKNYEATINAVGNTNNVEITSVLAVAYTVFG